MIAWFFFVLYALVTLGLALLGRKDAGSVSGFAIGSGAMNPLVVGITLGASLASAATFVLYPGFVYKDGLAGLAGFSIPLVLGLLTGLVVFSPRFQDIGASASALTVPHWLGSRWDDFNLRRLFAGLQILNVAYLVLIVVGCAYVMESSLGIPYHAAVVGIIAFVFFYTGLGGATAHAFTNTLQGILMLIVSLTVFFGGMHLWPEAWESLQSTGWTAPGSKLFSTSFEVWVVPFLIGIALTTQPHLLAKALYVKGRKNLGIVIASGIGTYMTYALMLAVGAYARVILPAGLAQDKVVGEYLQVAFTWPVVGAAISVAILAASMSTLDGLLVAIAASVGNDVLRSKGSVWVNRGVLVVLALATIAISWSPPKLVLILGQLGVYGLVAASVGPLLAGMWLNGPLRRWPAWIAALVPLFVHFGLALTIVENPGVSALAGMACGIPLAFLAAAFRPSPAAAPAPGGAP